MAKVRMLQGRYAGLMQEQRQDEAENNVATGMAEWVEQPLAGVPKVRDGKAVVQADAPAPAKNEAAASGEAPAGMEIPKTARLRKMRNTDLTALLVQLGGEPDADETKADLIAKIEQKRPAEATE